MKRKPAPWSYSSLSDFKNCPRQFYEKRVAKSVKEAPSQQMIWGNEVHKHFENRQKLGTPLPDSLRDHEPYMQKLEGLGAEESFTERKIGIGTDGKPCTFFARNVWWRGVIDYGARKGTTMLLVDYKTGKVKNNFEQLAMFGLHSFLQHPEVVSIDVEFYWTQTMGTSTANFQRSKMADLWGMFSPDLRQMKEAYEADLWQPRQSGLCRGWCPVQDCEFWQPKRT